MFIPLTSTFFAVADAAVPLASFVHKPVVERGDVDGDKHLSSVRMMSPATPDVRRQLLLTTFNVSMLFTAIIRSSIEAETLEKIP